MTNPGYLAFVTNAIVSPGQRSPFVVFVHPTRGIVVSAGFRKDFRDLTQHHVRWTPPRTFP